MYIVRRYGKLGWFDFLDQIEIEMNKTHDKSLYFELIDELRMRKIASVSEGGTFKLKKVSTDLLGRLEQRMAEDTTFATLEDHAEFIGLVSFFD
ncbi:hypothetical protein OAB57_01345 [Bacteriovoracaceae bacterium]|nr:hypothetical protein [Bacteriovoracaceae bacterium]